MKALRTCFSCVVLLGLNGGRQTAHAWSSYLHSLSSPPVTTAPPSNPSKQKSKEESQSNVVISAKSQGDYLSYLSSPQHLLTSPGAPHGIVGLQVQPHQPTQPAAVQEILKSTTGTDYLSRLSTGSATAIASPPKVVYAPVPKAGTGDQVREKSAMGATDYLSQLSVKPRHRPSAQLAAPKRDAGTVQTSSSVSLPTKTAVPLSDTQNGANFLSFLTSPTVLYTSKATEYPGRSARPEEARDTTGSYLANLSTPSSSELSSLRVSRDSKDSSPSLPTNPIEASKSSSTTPESSSKSKTSYSPYGTKPQTVQGSPFSAVGTSYMNFLGTGPTRTSWYAEPLYVKPSSRRKAETHRKDAEPDVKVPERSPFDAPTGTTKSVLHEEPKQLSPEPSSYLSSLGRPAIPGVANAVSESLPSASPLEGRGQSGDGVGYLASLSAGPLGNMPPHDKPSEAVSTPPSDYLSSLSGQPLTNSAPIEAAIPTIAPSSPASYLAGLSSATREVSPTVVAESSYLAGLSGAVKSEGSRVRTTYSPYGRIPKAATQAGYLSDLGRSSSPVNPSPVASSTVPKDYSPFGKLPKAVTPIAGYLSSLAGNDINPSRATESSAQRKSYSPFGSKPKAVASTGYLSGLGTANSTSTSSTNDTSANNIRENFSPFGSKPRQVKETGYLSTLAHGATCDVPSAPTVATPATYSPFGRKPMGALATGYLGTLSGAPQVPLGWQRGPPHAEAKTDAVLTTPDPKPPRGVLKPIASYHPVSGALVEIKSSR